MEKKTKQEIKAVLDKTHQDTNIPFREYPNLIKNIPIKVIATIPHPPIEIEFTFENKLNLHTKKTKGIIPPKII